MFAEYVTLVNIFSDMNYIFIKDNDLLDILFYSFVHKILLTLSVDVVLKGLNYKSQMAFSLQEIVSPIHA